MVIDLFCLIVASARAMFAELLVWFADPARSLAPHLDGAHFSSSGLSETGPFSVWASELPAKITSSAISTIDRTLAYLIQSPLGSRGARSRETRRCVGADRPRVLPAAGADDVPHGASITTTPRRYPSSVRCALAA